jgi:hypothetical protein
MLVYKLNWGFILLIYFSFTKPTSKEEKRPWAAWVASEEWLDANWK